MGISEIRRICGSTVLKRPDGCSRCGGIVSLFGYADDREGQASSSSAAAAGCCIEGRQGGGGCASPGLTFIALANLASGCRIPTGTLIAAVAEKPARPPIG